MTNRERALAILNYKNYDRLPIVHFAFWSETLDKWAQEGKIPNELIKNKKEDTRFPLGRKVAKHLGFDFGWGEENSLYAGNDLFPAFEPKIIEITSDGFVKKRNGKGVIELHRGDAGSIPAEAGHTLVDRKSYEEEIKWRLEYTEERINFNAIKTLKENLEDAPVGMYCGSLFGIIRDIMGVQGVSYLFADDEDLYDEIISKFGNLAYKIVKRVLEEDIKFDCAYFWEDICFKNGPLVIPSIFDEKVGPYYKKITELLKNNGIQIISLDCDGVIDSLIPTWINNGVNTMFPIEVGTWEASIKPWREKYGKELRGVGGMDKKVFACDYSAIDKEIERLRPLVELGGYIPCPDHRIPPDAKWENVQYYCDRMRTVFG